MKKLPIGIPSFSKIVSGEYFYIDKTKQLVNLIEDGDFFFLSRPHGFGKSLAVSTLEALFSGNKVLFKGLYAEQWVKNSYPVLRFDLGALIDDSAEKYQKSLQSIIDFYFKKYSIDYYKGDIVYTFQHLLSVLHEKQGSIVLLIDHYDKSLAKNFNKYNILVKIREVIKEFYEIIDSNINLFRFIFVTGKEDFEEFGFFSTLKRLNNITNSKKFFDIVGFNRDELEDIVILYYTENNNTPLSKAEFLDSIAAYSGEFLLDGIDTIYDPHAILQCLSDSDPENYSTYIDKNTTSKSYTCLNPGDSAFIHIIQSDIYIDKTEMISYINKYVNTSKKYICVSRPRRFGKTTTIDMLSSFYDRTGSAKDVFKNLKIFKDVSFKKFANKFIVIKINIQTFLSQTHDITQLIEKIKDSLYYDLVKQFDIELSSSNLNQFLRNIYLNTGKKFVITIDEWDCIFREFKDKKDWQEQYLDFLRYWFKDQDNIALVYMTGILPIKKYGTHSALNMFNEYSMLNASPFIEFVGFTESEVKNLCNDYKRDFPECKIWYDGYKIDNCHSIYNPRSVIEYISRGIFDTYWNNTETYEALQIYITMEFLGLKETIIKLLSNESVKINTRTFTNDMRTFSSQDDILTLLVHLGYLSYDTQSQSVRIPNKEIAFEFISAIQNNGWPTVVQAIRHSEELLRAVLAKDAKKVAEGIEAVHLETSILTYNDENALAYTISLAFFAAREFYTIVRECPTGKGFADCIFLPRPNTTLPPLIVELKWKSSADTAIAQCLERNYPHALLGRGQVLLVGISYSPKTKKHTCRIESIST